ncbi:HlyD family efflux transporter periplasmic adaptor subunit [Pseudidiomarina halophila]|uniref:HlyD family efflux transporter periplasmic adaptor subunit n=1 Tax=Pseudidiomarina halophila TaxID=1449799 RepID=UPI003615D18B
MRALDEEISALNRNLELVREEILISQKLVRDGDVGKIELLRLQQREAELQGAVSNRRNKYFADSQAEMTKAEEQLASEEQILAERNEILNRTEIKASSDGVVRRIYFTTPGAKLRPGDVVLELVPTDSDLVIEAKLSPADMAKVRAGLPAYFKVDAYDYSIYGSFKTEVIYISPDALSEKAPTGNKFSIKYG